MATTGDFKIPVDLLKQFQHEVRFIPNHLPVAGYIIFDREMLKSILTSRDAEARAKFAEQLNKIYEAGGELVIVAKASTQAPR